MRVRPAYFLFLLRLTVAPSEVTVAMNAILVTQALRAADAEMRCSPAARLVRIPIRGLLRRIFFLHDERLVKECIQDDAERLDHLWARLT